MGSVLILLAFIVGAWVYHAGRCGASPVPDVVSPVIARLKKKPEQKQPEPLPVERA